MYLVQTIDATVVVCGDDRYICKDEVEAQEKMQELRDSWR